MRPLVIRFPLFGTLFILFSCFALLELVLLVWLAANTGFFFTLALVLLTALVGAALARSQGVAVVQQASRDLSMGRLPTRPLMEGVMILLGGAFLVTPGLITDCIGISVMIPVCRRWYIRRAQAFIKKHFRVVETRTDLGGQAWPRPDDDDVIDVDFREEK